jgi:hypothetical protein
MGNGIVEIRARVCAMIEAARETLGKAGTQLRSGTALERSDARWLLERIAHTLTAHIDELSEHLRRLGGSVAESNHSQPATACANVLVEVYTDLSMAHAQALLLERDARAQGYSSSAAMATRHREEIATLLQAIREQLPDAA